RRRTPARHDGRHDEPSGVRRAHRDPCAVRRRFALLHRADAGRRAGGHLGDRQGRGHQCGAACRQRAGAQRHGAGRAARRMPRRAGGARRRAPLRRGQAVSAPVMTPLEPGATIGILGGGQLGRMLALAAARLGLKCHVFCPDPQAPAFDVVRRTTLADYGDESALDRFAEAVDVITYEFENVPAETAAFLAERRPVLPNPAVLATTPDRLTEKTFVSKLDVRTAPFAAVDNPASLNDALAHIGRPAVLKTRRFGYDGKGQALIRESTDPAQTWKAIGAHPAIVEAFVPFEREI